MTDLQAEPTNVLLDTNLLVRLVNPLDSRHGTATRAVAKLVTRGCQVCLVPQCCYEFFVVATRPRDVNGLAMEPADALDDIDDFVSRFTLLKDERGVFTRWRELVREVAVRGRPAHDARLVAAMRRHGLTHVLTFNGKDFRRYAGVTVLAPAVAA